MKGVLARAVMLTCIIRATILRCDYPVLYVLRFYVANATILARILRCYPIFAKKALRRPPALTRLTSFPGIAINWTIQNELSPPAPLRAVTYMHCMAANCY